MPLLHPARVGRFAFLLCVERGMRTGTAAVPRFRPGNRCRVLRLATVQCQREPLREPLGLRWIDSGLSALEWTRRFKSSVHDGQGRARCNGCARLHRRGRRSGCDCILLGVKPASDARLGSLLTAPERPVVITDPDVRNRRLPAPPMVATDLGCPYRIWRRIELLELRQEHLAWTKLDLVL